MSSIYDIHGSLREALRQDRFRAAEAQRAAVLNERLNAGRRLLAELTKLREDEAKLDAKLKTLPTWSDRWWLVLGQINAARTQRIDGFDAMKEFAV